MPKFKEADFYYGSVLSLLFNQDIKPALVEGNADRQIYDFTTNHVVFRLFIKYRAKKRDIKTKDYNSWTFKIADESKELQNYIDQGINLIVALVCGSSKLTDSELALLDKEDLKQILVLNKKSITISRQKGEHSFRISIGGGRDLALKIPCDRFDELFL